MDFDEPSEKYEKALEACKKRMPQADEHTLSSCAESLLLEDVLQRLKALR